MAQQSGEGTVYEVGVVPPEVLAEERLMTLIKSLQGQNTEAGRLDRLMQILRGLKSGKMTPGQAEKEINGIFPKSEGHVPHSEPS